MEDISIANINDKPEILENHVSEIVNNTNLFATHLEKSDRNRRKLNNGIFAHVAKIHNNYEPNLHMPRHFTPLTEEKHPVKGSLTPFLEENSISAKDITKLEEWATFSG
ncbi:hypothetical protein O181_080790 [Austropuccinia psidii MF-1]|uniref:Uncharacterized protein n=1 Tax=Austropuccinia psidii MF-1 TaxID=1389203 RepID=A0A9Q3IJ85_9BASI|nr:hypothetical protein [Austropuccinia psidii MF-1]